MRPRIGYLYSALAVIFAVAFGLGVGDYWVDDSIALAIMILAVIVLCLSTGKEMKSLTTWWAPTPKEDKLAKASQAVPTEVDFRKYVPRSRIAHFVLLSRIRFNPAMTWGAYNDFERRLLSRKGWQGLSADELAALAETENVGEKGPPSRESLHIRH